MGSGYLRRGSTLALLAGAVLLALTSSRAGAQSDSGMNDREFARFIARENLTEIRMARLALERSKNDTVQRFAKMMIDDHTQAGTDLAKVSGTAMPTTTGAEQDADAAKLQGLSGADFDKKYMEMQVAEHYKEVSLSQTEIDRGAEPMKGFTSQYLVSLQRHLRMAQAVVNNADRYLK